MLVSLSFADDNAKSKTNNTEYTIDCQAISSNLIDQKQTCVVTRDAKTDGITNITFVFPDKNIIGVTTLEAIEQNQWKKKGFVFTNLENAYAYTLMDINLKAGESISINLFYTSYFRGQTKFNVLLHHNKIDDALKDPSLIELELDPWADPNYRYCRIINITNNFPVNYTHAIIVNTTNFNYSSVQADGDDVRFYEGNNCYNANTTAGVLYQELMYWNTSGKSKFYVKTLSNSTFINSVLLYYGNAGATNASNRTMTYIMGGVVDGDFVDNSTWNVLGAGFTFANSTLYANNLTRMLDWRVWADLGLEAASLTSWKMEALASYTADQLGTTSACANVMMESPAANCLLPSQERNRTNFYWESDAAPDHQYLMNSYNGAISSVANNSFKVSARTIPYYTTMILNGTQNTYIYFYNNSERTIIDMSINNSISVPSAGKLRNIMPFSTYATGAGDTAESRGTMAKLRFMRYTSPEPTYAINSEVVLNAVSNCTTIGSSDTYSLTNNLQGAPISASPATGNTCIKITASNVTLNCFGYSITNNATTGNITGISIVTGASNVTLTNCRVYNMSRGIFVFKTNTTTILNASTYNNSDDGIRLYESNLSIISNNFVYGNSASGIDLLLSWFNNITNNTGENNSLDGIRIDAASIFNIIKNNYVFNNTVNGISFLTNSNNNTALNNTIVLVAQGGIRLDQNINGSIVANNTINQSNSGIFLHTHANENTIIGNTINNATFGIRLEDANYNNNITNNTVYHSYRSLYLEPSSNNFFNFTVGYNNTHGKVTWRNLTTSNSSLAQLTDGINILLQPSFVSLNATAVPEFNNSAIVSISSSNCLAGGSVVRLDGFPQSRAEILASGKFVGFVDRCQNGIGTFNVSSWSGYTLGDVNLSLNVTFDQFANETENKTMTITLSGKDGNITSYTITIVYNQTLIANLTETGINNNTITRSVGIVSPLVVLNLTNKTWDINASATVLGTTFNSTNTGNQTIHLWYYISKYNFTKLYNYTIEEINTIYNSVPVNPPLAFQNVTYTQYHSFAYCLAHNSSGGVANTTSCGATLLTSGLLDFNILPAHRNISNIVFQDYFVIRNWSLNFNAAPEAISSKYVFDSGFNASREIMVWLVNYTNGTLGYNLSNLSTILFITFYDEETFAALNIDSSIGQFSTRTSDGFIKNHTVSYGGVGAVQNSTVKAHPSYALFNITSVEVYSKSGYVTRSRFMVNEAINGSTQYNISVYLLATGSASYTVITVLDAGNAVAGAYVKIYKYYASSGLYIDVEEKRTNNDGKTPAYLDIDAYYKFVVLDSSGNQIYTSVYPEQFICSPVAGQACVITLNAHIRPQTELVSPYITARCYGNVTDNSIRFSYSDALLITDSINFLAWRASNITTYTPVCNNTVTGYSGSYACLLLAPENLTQFQYYCEIRKASSDSTVISWSLIDLAYAIRSAATNLDWLIVVLGMLIVVSFITSHPAIGTALATITVVGLSLMQYVKLSIVTTMGFLIVGAIVTYLLLREDG